MKKAAFVMKKKNRTHKNKMKFICWQAGEVVDDAIAPKRTE